VKFGRPQLFSFSTPLEIELRGQDLEALQRAGRKLSALMQDSPHFADVKSSVEQGYPEVQIRFDQERAAALGLTSRQIADQVVRQVRGEVATRYSFRDRKIDVLVRGDEKSRASVDDIRRIIVNPQAERPVTLDAVADVVETVGPSEIHRADQTRVALVSSNLRGVDLGTAVKEVQQLVREHPLGADVRLAFGGQSEELDSSIRSLLFAFGLAIFLVYLVMASQFESLLHPFVIMFSVPLAMVGAVLALWLSRSPVSVVVFIGLILLVGIVVKNAIVLIDKVNQLREEGVAKREAICQGAESRLRPIAMTTLCTLFGFAPAGLLRRRRREVRAPMAITVIGGLAVSTLLTLVVIPIMYDRLDRKSDAAYKARGDAARARGEGRPAPPRARTHDAGRAQPAPAGDGRDVLRLDGGDRPDRLLPLPLEQFPEVNVPFLMINFPYPGSTPQEVERSITRPGRGGAGHAAGHQGAELDLARRRRRRDDPVQGLGPRHPDHRQRGARPHRRDPLRAAGRPAALLRQQLLAQRPADHPHALLVRPGPAQGIRPDRARGEAAHRARARRGARGPVRRAAERGRDLDRPGAPGRAQRRPQPAGGEAAGDQLLGVGRRDQRRPAPPARAAGRRGSSTWTSCATWCSTSRA
jgi:hypothetical protein